jgi:hypothetical protein
MVFVGALLVIVTMGAVGAELVRMQCRRMLAKPLLPAAPRARRASAYRPAHSAFRPPVHAAALRASPREG